MSILQRREEEKQNRIRLILEAALQIFSEKGFSDCNIQDIADRARLGKATLYYYFPNKETLFRRLVKEETQRFYRLAAERIPEEASPIEAVRALLFFYIEYFRANPRLLHLFFPLGKSSPILIRRDRKWEQEAQSWRRPLEEKLDHCFAAAAKIASSAEIIRILWTFLVGISIKMIQKTPTEDLRAEAETFVQMIHQHFFRQEEAKS